MAMGLVCKVALAAIVVLALGPALRPALAQSPGASMMPIGAQNPAVTQPPPIAPRTPVVLPPSTTVVPQEPAPPPANQSPASMIIPGGAAGLCECLINHDPSAPAFDKTKMHQSCLASVDACQAACNSDHYYTFVPHAAFTCPAHPTPETGHIALNARSAVRPLSER
jgi:hypothetical protein